MFAFKDTGTMSGSSIKPEVQICVLLLDYSLLTYFYS
jgi:hypothetical protein